MLGTHHPAELPLQQLPAAPEDLIWRDGGIGRSRRVCGVCTIDLHENFGAVRIEPPCSWDGAASALNHDIIQEITRIEPKAERSLMHRLNAAQVPPYLWTSTAFLCLQILLVC